MRNSQKSKSLLKTLRDLLATESVGTQEEIKAALKKMDIDANQSKISRSLHKLGAIKIKNQTGDVVYRLPKEPAPPTSRSALANLIIEIIANEFLIMVHTSPGSASLIARMLDHHQKQLNILGTVAGDDSIIVIPKSVTEISHVISAIKLLLTDLHK